MHLVVPVAFALVASPAAGLTGAEFKQADPSFASGYVLGVVEDRVLVVDTDDPRIEAIRACVFGAKINSATLYDLVISWLARNPKDLPLPALGSIYKAVNEMCGQ
ncbi:hypothetical protein OSH10_04955 [Kaistia defluvii]|uniref:hypothetical protein n=1 Tax=Kaistia defluvii TaxID=410841 RepID=UPI002258BAEB|nr:hypothetical protein [Kaistia defluvii]MCX5517775.1 hypothetical protein [Kaistia defluvii]